MISPDEKINSDDIQERIKKAVPEAIAKALKRHKQAGQSIVVWRDGRVVEIPPEKIRGDQIKT